MAAAIDSPHADGLELNRNELQTEGQDEKTAFSQSPGRFTSGDLSGCAGCAAAQGCRNCRRRALHSPKTRFSACLRRFETWGILSQAFHYGRGEPGGWWIVDEPELHLGEDIVVPEIAGWRRERMPEHPMTAYSTLAPDWACEILSPSTRLFDIGGKRAVCARQSVGHVWFVDPTVRSLEAFELCGSQWLLTGARFDDAPVSLPPFEAISFNLGDSWPPQAVRRDAPTEEQPGEPTAEF